MSLPQEPLPTCPGIMVTVLPAPAQAGTGLKMNQPKGTTSFFLILPSYTTYRIFSGEPCTLSRKEIIVSLVFSWENAGRIMDA